MDGIELGSRSSSSAVAWTSYLAKFSKLARWLSQRGGRLSNPRLRLPREISTHGLLVRAVDLSKPHGAFGCRAADCHGGSLHSLDLLLAAQLRSTVLSSSGRGEPGHSCPLSSAAAPLGRRHDPVISMAALLAPHPNRARRDPRGYQGRLIRVVTYPSLCTTLRCTRTHLCHRAGQSFMYPVRSTWKYPR